MKQASVIQSKLPWTNIGALKRTQL